MECEFTVLESQENLKFFGFSVVMYFAYSW